jgi:hypothetical protein
MERASSPVGTAASDEPPLGASSCRCEISCATPASGWGTAVTPDGQRLLSREAIGLMQTSQVQAPEDLLTMGLTWALADLSGATLLAHDGTTVGQVAAVGRARARLRALRPHQH